MESTPNFRGNLYHNYSDESAKGLFGFILSRGHRLLEKTYLGKKSSDLIFLEIGGGRNPHYKWIEDSSVIREYFVEDVDVQDLEKQNFELIQKTPNGWRDSTNFESYFDRIIACHVLEHLQHPEVQLYEWLNLLKDGGTISILLPNDPGLIWGSARVLYRKKLQKKGWVDLREYDFALALEHVNSIQNLIRICKFVGMEHELKIKYWPFRIPFAFFNMQTVIHIQKKHQ
jgi:phosphatidylethanolamine/phosphatidyl-N-methylethanolamine N-methyltransferase